MKEREDLDMKFVGTFVDRQVRIEDWNQQQLSKQTATILGIGGLGSVVLIGLLRLGIKKIQILDYDVVELHNLNRQLIFCKEDIKQRKVGAALKNAKFHAVGDTQLEGFDGNALTNWKKIIDFVDHSDVVFNCIDYGDSFDVAVSALCLKLGKPLIMGGTFATSMTVDFLSPLGKPCFLCINDQISGNKELMLKIHPDRILEHEDVSFLPKNDNPISRSSSVVCTICGEFMLSHYLNYLFLAFEKPYKSHRFICYHNTFEMFSFELERVYKCAFCGNPKYVAPAANDLTDLI